MMEPDIRDINYTNMLTYLATVMAIQAIIRNENLTQKNTSITTKMIQKSN